MLLKEMYDDI